MKATNAYPKTTAEYDEGYRAAQNGAAQGACPYDGRTQKGRDWLRGWLMAERIQPIGSLRMKGTT